MTIDMATRYYVLFRSSFAYEAAPNISHELENATSERTYCGRRGWETYEPDDNNLEPDCLICRRAAAKRKAA